MPRAAVSCDSVATVSTQVSSVLGSREPYVVEAVNSDTESSSESDGDNSGDNSDTGSEKASIPAPPPGPPSPILEPVRVSGLDTPETEWKHAPPTASVAKVALEDLRALLRPRKPSGGRKPFGGGDVLYERLEMMRGFLWAYVDGRPPAWMDASLRTAHFYQRGPALARRLRQWTRSFIDDRHCLPVSTKGSWNASALDNEELEHAICLHLQGLGLHIRALDIVEYLAEPDVQQRFGLKKTVALSTAQGWMHRLGYRWKKVPNGQYIDGHEREDVVHYRQDVFLPAVQRYLPTLQQWTKDGTPSVDPSPTQPSLLHTATPHNSVQVDTVSNQPEPDPPPRRTVFWWHDESTFYANDRRKVRWVHEKEKAVPRAKGEGVSLMVSDFFSADHGWLRSRDGKRSARQLFRAGKNRDGYFTNEDVLAQVSIAMDIARVEWPDVDHVFIFDNATTHLKRAPDALSARKMPKGPSAAFGADTLVLNEDSKPVFGSDGKALKERVRMADARLADGTAQSLYFPNDHPDEALRGHFKGMATILKERGYENTDMLRYECAGFKCPPPSHGMSPLDFYSQSPCCCRRLLYHQPDFQAVKSLLEIRCEAAGFTCIFLPKFHCELNPIEQCWGYAKREYRKLPASTKESDLEANMFAALESVPLASMRR